MSDLKDAKDLTQGPIGRTLFFFALPILAGNCAQSLNGSINAMWIGRYLGEAALTAASNANTVLFFLTSFVIGTAMAATILLGHAVGRQNKAELHHIMGTGLTIFAAIATLICSIGFFLTPSLLDLMQTPPSARLFAIDYLRLIFLGVPALFVFLFLTSALRGVGDARTPLYFSLLAIVLDVLLNPLFIFGLKPIHAMGIAGSAVAMLLSQTCALLSLLYYLHDKQHLLWLGRSQWSYLRIQWPIARAILLKGLPMGGQLTLLSLSIIAILTMVNPYGTPTAAAYGAATQLWGYIQMPAIAVAAACSAMAAQNIGSQRWDRVDAITRYGVLWNVVMTGTAIGAILAFERSLFQLFIPPHTAAMLIGLHLNHIVIGSFLFFGIVLVVSSVIRASGHVIVPLVILAISLWGIRIPMARLLTPIYGADGIWWSFPFSSVTSTVLSLSYYKWGKWRQQEF